MNENVSSIANQDVQNLLRELEASKLIHEQIAKLNSARNLGNAINETLSAVGGFLGAERAYMFERSGNTYSNTFEWCAENVTAEIDTLQNIPEEDIIHWISVLSQGKCVIIPDIETIRLKDPVVYDILKRQDITSVVEAPIMIGERLAGFIGVDNADCEKVQIISEALTLLGTFLGTVIRNKAEHLKLKQSHYDIKNSHDMQNEMVSSISCGVLAFTLPQNTILTINDEAKRITGCSETDDPGEAFKRYLYNDVIPEDRHKVADLRLHNPGETRHSIYHIMRDGKILTVKTNVKMLLFSNSQKYVLCSMLDISEQADLMDALATERKSYRDALAKGSEFTFFFDVTEGYIHHEFMTAHNVNLIREMGLTVPASFDELLKRYVESSDIQFVHKEMEKNFTCKGLLESFADGITNVVSEFYNPKTNIYIRSSALMSFNEKTKHVMASVVAEDITEARRMEAERKKKLESANRSLAEANQLLSRANEEMRVRIDAILNGISGGLKIIDVDDDYRYVHISEGAAQLQGYTVEEFLEQFGTRVTNNICPEDAEAALAEASRKIEEQGFYAVKYRVPHKDGTIRWVIDRGKLVIDELTHRKQWYILMQDVTELEDRNISLSNVLAMQQAMSDSLGSGILAYTIPERNILLMNAEAQKMFSFRNMGVKDHFPDIMDRILPEDIPAMREAVKNLRNIGDSIRYILHIRNSDSVLSLKCTSKLLSFVNGQKYILSSMSDMTEQEMLEKRIDQERRQYRNALAFGSAAFFSIDIPDGILTEHIISRNGENLTKGIGLTIPATYDELVNAWFASGRTVSDNQDISILKDKQRMMDICRSGNNIIDFEYHVPSNGKYYHIMVLPDNIGGSCRISFIIYDITADRQEDQQRLSVINTIGQIYSGLYLFNLKDHSCTAFKQHSDISADIPSADVLEHFINVYTTRYVHPEFSEKVKEFLLPDNIRKTLANTYYSSIEYRRNDLGWCRVSIIAASRDNDGVVTSVVFAGYVIEKQKQLELTQQEALRIACESANIANAAKTEFLANMSHDIRTPMNAIIGMTAIAGTHLDDKERVADCLSKITVSSKHLLGLINEVLDMSKIESGKLDLHEDEFNLPELIDNLITMSKPDIQAKNHDLSVCIDSITHENVIGDSQHIQQVFMNLMSNAIKYTPDGGKIKLTISEKATNKFRTACYEFIFEDNGIGMSEDFLEHLFEPFSRARNDHRLEKIQGTGLGMPITKNIVQMMNGDIKVESKLNVGTRITVTFLLKLKNEEEIIDYDKFIDLNVLVADDDIISCEYTCSLLKEIGINGEWVLSGQEAVDRAVEAYSSGNDFFAVILDWQMPGMDGIETSKQIRQKVGKDVPIIIISAFDWTDIELKARAAGVNAFISKPLFKSRMIHLFHELVNGEEKGEKNTAIAELKKADFTGKRALLVEDNELNSEIAGEIIGMAGLEVSFAANGKEAVDIMTTAEDGQFDVIFMDIQMPVMNGYEAAVAIRALPGNYPKSVPIIAMTANAFSEDVVAAKNAGMNEHIAKPLDFDQLLKAMQKWLA